MATTPNSIITPQKPYIAFADLTGGTTATGSVAVTSRAPQTATTNLSPLGNSPADGRQINSITVRGASTSITAATAAMIVFVWEYDGTNYKLVDEIPVTAVTPSTSAPAFTVTNYYSGWIVPASHTLWVSSTVATGAATTALYVMLKAGDL